MQVGTKVFIKSLKKTGVIVECESFPHGRVPIDWPLVRIDDGGFEYRTSEFFDPDDLEILPEVIEQVTEVRMYLEGDCSRMVCIKLRDTNNMLWAITNDDGRSDFCLNRDLEWEPLTFDRADEWHERCRFSLNEAKRLATKYLSDVILTKKCTKCNEIKDLCNFIIREGLKQGGKHDGRRNQCLSCLQELRKKRYEDRYKDDEVYKAKRKERLREYYAKNFEDLNRKSREYYAKNTEKGKLARKSYYNSHKKEFAAKEAKRKAAKLKATPPWLTKEHFEEIKKIYKSCPKGHHVDHIEPLQGKDVCGLHVPWNLQVILAADNLMKSNKRQIDTIAD